jgi:hypothetical protein
MRRRLPRTRDEPHRLVFVDETCAKANMVRLRGEAPVGQRLRADAPFGRWRTQTFLAGLTADASIAPWIIEGAMGGAPFTAWVETQFAPEPVPGTVVILDDLSTHKVAPAARALRRAGCWLLFLPPCSPDRPAPRTSTRSKSPSRSSGPTSDASAREPSMTSRTQSARPAGCSAQTSAETTPVMRATRQCRGPAP